jgi:hypothetical protein
MTDSNEADDPLAPLRVPFDPEVRARHEAAMARINEHREQVELTRRHR